MQQTMAWTEKYRPSTASMLLGNEEAVSEFNTWLKSTKRKPKKAALLVGPPGVGKTSLTRAAANDNHFRVIEMNASDVRTEKSIHNLLALASTSSTLESFTSQSQGNLILIDEVDGVFGREDRGGLGAILEIIRDAPLPVVLTANNLENEKFDDLRNACQVIELVEIRPRLLVALIRHIFAQEGIHQPIETINEMARGARGDMRSAINDAQALAAAGTLLESARTRELDELETLKKLLASKRFTDARRALNETELPLYRDELMLLLHDLLPYLYSAPEKLRRAYEVLSRADIAYGRIGVNRSRSLAPPPFNLPRRDSIPEWSLLPVALNELATVGLRSADNDIEHALEVAPRVSQKTIERYQYRLWTLDHLCGSIAKACHLSKRRSLHEILPFLTAIFKVDEQDGRIIASSLGLEERDIQFLTAESKVTPAPSGPETTLDPNAFKLPYMRKDKFIQLMRIGLKYDRASGKFSLRRLDNLDSVEQSLTQIISKPVKFKRLEQHIRVHSGGDAVKECYVDSNQVNCAECDFVAACPTHTIAALKFCLCDETLADQAAYEKYVTKNQPATHPLKRTARKKS